MPKFFNPDEFELQSFEHWKSLVEPELKGKSYSDFLEHDAPGGVVYHSYESADTAINLPSSARETPWLIIEPIFETDATQANKKALESLMQGAEGIWFMKPFRGAALEVASSQIDQEIAPVFSNDVDYPDPFKLLLRNGERVNFESKKASINGYRLRQRGSDPVLEIASILVQLDEILFNADHINEVLIISGTGSDYLLEIAKWRALRLLTKGWVGRHASKQLSLKYLSRNLSIDYTKNDAYNNILRATSSAMSAVLGGADMVMLEPWDRYSGDETAFSARISRNIQVLMKEEARLTHQLDPVSGSYFIDRLTHTMMNKALEVAKTMEAAGGFQPYVKGRHLYEAFQSNRSNIVDQIDRGEKVVIGLNKFQVPNPVEETAVRATDYEFLPPVLHVASEYQKTPSK